MGADGGTLFGIRRALRAGAVLMVFIGSGLAMSVSPAAADTPYSVSGKVERPGASLFQRLPVAGALVQACWDFGSCVSTTSAADGTYALSWVKVGPTPGGVVTFTVTPPPSAFLVPFQQTRSAQGGAWVVNFNLTPMPSSLTGTVVDSNGAPVVGATVSMMRFPGPFFNWFSATTNANGAYSFPAGVVQVNVQFVLWAYAPSNRPDLALENAAGLFTPTTVPMVVNFVIPPADLDGIAPTVENAGPNGGDGNGDGIADSTQPNVASLPNVVDGQYVTVAVPAGASLRSVVSSAVPAAPAPPAGADLPFGLIGFEVLVPTPGATTTVTLYVPPGSALDSYYKLHDGTWTDVSHLVVFAGDTMTLTLTDGGMGDDDGVADGVIVDPGGPGTIVDSTPPTITPVISGTLGTDDWYTSAVDIAWTVTDAESDVTDTAGCADVTFSTDMSGVTVTCAATSRGGSSSASVTIRIDGTAPVLDPSVSSSPILLNGIATASAGATDATSGVVAASCDAVDTSAVGVATVECSAVDAAGNETTTAYSYQVVYQFDGFDHPVNAAPALNSAKAGRAIPLKWRITDANGVPVTDLSAATLRALTLTCSLGTSADQVEEYAAGGSGLQNLGDGYYQINWKTPSTYAKSCKTLQLDLGEGADAEHVAQFEFTK